MIAEDALREPIFYFTYTQHLFPVGLIDTFAVYTIHVWLRSKDHSSNSLAFNPPEESENYVITRLKHVALRRTHQIKHA